jgi:hypothetical protein
MAAKNQTGGAFKALGASLAGVGNWFKNSKIDIALTAGQMLLFSDAGKKGAKSVEEVEKAAQSAANRTALAFGTMTGAINLTVQAAGFLKNAFGDALDRQKQNLSAVITATKVYGVTQQEATAIVENFNKRVATLGKELPTSSENISIMARTIRDDYALALKSAGASVSQIEDILIGSSTNIALLSELAGGDINDTVSALTSYFSGSIGKMGIDRYAFFAANTNFRNELIGGADKMGKDFTDMSGLERVKLMVQTLDKAITPENVEQAKMLSTAKISALMDTLFDPEEGIFSIQRDLEPKLPGYQSVFKSMERTLDLVIGDNGIMAAIADLAGIGSATPMKMLRTAIEEFNSFLQGLIDSIKKLPRLNLGLELKPQDALKGFDFGIIGKAIAGIINSIFRVIDGAALGKFAANLINLGVGVIISTALSVLGGLDYGVLVSTVITAFFSFLANLDWRIYAAFAAWTIISALAPILSFIVVLVFTVLLGQLLTAVFGQVLGIIIGLLLPIIAPILLALGGAIVVLIVGLVVGLVALGKWVYDNRKNISDAYLNFMDNVAASMDRFFAGIAKGWDQLGKDAATDWANVVNATKKASDSYLNFMDGVESSLDGFFEGVGVQVGRLSRASARGWDNTVKGFNNFVAGVGAWLGNLFKFVGEKGLDAIAIAGNFFNSVAASIGDAAKGVFDFFKDVFDAIIETMQSIWDRVVGGVQTALSSVGNAVASPVAAVGNAVSSGVTAVQNFGSNVTSKVVEFFTPRYAGGYFPQAIPAALGLLDAVAMENLMKPAGSTLAIANSSEAILQPQQLANIVTNTYNAGASTSSPTINIAGGAITLVVQGDNARSVAMEAIAILEDMITSELQSRLS